MGEMLLYSTLAGMATGVGALVVVLFGKPPAKVLSAMLGFAAGIMLAISAVELMPEALEMGGLVSAVLGFLLGAALMAGLDHIVPHMHPLLNGRHKARLPDDASSDMLKLGLFIAVGIGLHNLPEGLAIGAGFTTSATLGLALVISIALHNIPEGMVTAGPLLMGGLSKLHVVGLTTLAGLMTPIGTLLGAAVFSVSEAFISWALAFAAGAMVYIVCDELIPQSHRYHSQAANVGLLIGFVLAFALA